MTKPLSVLVEEGLISKKVVEKLKKRWINNVDEIYATIRACRLSGEESMINTIASELEIKPESLEGFGKYLEIYVSPKVLNAEKPKQYPLGLRLY